MEKKTKVWVKLIFIIVITFIFLLIIFMNRNNKTDIWLLFYTFHDVVVLWIILITAIITLIIERVLKFVFQTIKELKELRSEETKPENNTKQTSQS